MAKRKRGIRHMWAQLNGAKYIVALLTLLSFVGGWLAKREARVVEQTALTAQADATDKKLDLHIKDAEPLIALLHDVDRRAAATEASNKDTRASVEQLIRALEVTNKKVDELILVLLRQEKIKQ